MNFRNTTPLLISQYDGALHPAGGIDGLIGRLVGPAADREGTCRTVRRVCRRPAAPGSAFATPRSPLSDVAQVTFRCKPAANLPFC